MVPSLARTARPGRRLPKSALLAPTPTIHPVSTMPSR